MRAKKRGRLQARPAFRRLNVPLGSYFTGVRTDSDFLSVRFGASCIGPCLSRNPGYARFDFSGSYRVSHGVTFYARATNLFDKQYQDALGYPALGRDMRAGVRYTFSGRN